MTRYAKLTTGLVGAWFVSSLAASAFHLYRTRANHPPLPLGLAALTPIIVFLVWYATSPGLRQFTRTLDPRILTAIQSWRAVGFLFLVLASYRILPRMFALPAGWGDIAIGVTAGVVALRLAVPEHRRLFITWQVLGITDLVLAVILGTLVPILHPEGIPTDAMTMLPLSVIPTFIVPLLLILHVICIAQAKGWPVRDAASLGRGLHSQVARSSGQRQWRAS